jgi:hypothetical protein
MKSRTVNAAIRESLHSSFVTSWGQMHDAVRDGMMQMEASLRAVDAWNDRRSPGIAVVVRLEDGRVIRAWTRSPAYLDRDLRPMVKLWPTWGRWSWRACELARVTAIADVREERP